MLEAVVTAAALGAGAGEGGGPGGGGGLVAGAGGKETGVVGIDIGVEGGGAAGVTACPSVTQAIAFQSHSSPGSH